MEHTVPNQSPVPAPIQSRSPVAPGIQAQVPVVGIQFPVPAPLQSRAAVSSAGIQPQVHCIPAYAQVPIVAFDPLPTYLEFNPQEYLVQQELIFATVRKQNSLRKRHADDIAYDTNQRHKRFKAEHKALCAPVKEARLASKLETSIIASAAEQQELSILGKSLRDPRLRHVCFAPIAGNLRCGYRKNLRAIPGVDADVAFVPKFCKKHFSIYHDDVDKLLDLIEAALEAYDDFLAGQNDATVESIDEVSNAPNRSIPVKTNDHSEADDESDLVSDAMDVDDEDIQFARVQQSLRNLADRPQLKEEPISPSSQVKSLFEALGLDEDFPS